MTDLRPAALLTRPVPDGGMDAVVTEGRRRRRNALGLAGGATTLVAAVAAAVLLIPSTPTGTRTIAPAGRPVVAVGIDTPVTSTDDTCLNAQTTGRSCTGILVQPSAQGVTIGTPVTFTQTFCVAAGQPAVVNSYLGGQQHDVLVTGNGRSWTWSANRTFSPDPSGETVEPGSCLTWTSRWDVLDDDGRPMPPGTYDVELEFFTDSSTVATAGTKLTVLAPGGSS